VISFLALAVPSYGAMALKPMYDYLKQEKFNGLAVPSYGAMALKHLGMFVSLAIVCDLQSPPTGRWP